MGWQTGKLVAWLGQALRLNHKKLFIPRQLSQSERTYKSR